MVWEPASYGILSSPRHLPDVPETSLRNRSCPRLGLTGNVACTVQATCSGDLMMLTTRQLFGLRKSLTACGTARRVRRSARFVAQNVPFRRVAALLPGTS